MFANITRLDSVNIKMPVKKFMRTKSVKNKNHVAAKTALKDTHNHVNTFPKQKDVSKSVLICTKMAKKISKMT